MSNLILTLRRTYVIRRVETHHPHTIIPSSLVDLTENTEGSQTERVDLSTIFVDFTPTDPIFLSLVQSPSLLK